MNTENLTAAKIAEKIIAGERLTAADNLKFFTSAPLLSTKIFWRAVSIF